MADTTDILGLRIPSADGSDVADLAAIIGNLGNDVDEVVGNPSMTTTQINALAGDAKAAGRRVWDSTLGVEKVSNGTTWEIQASKAYVDAEKLDKSGGTLSGDLIFDNDDPDGHKIMFRQSGVDGWRILADTGGVFAVQRRDSTTGEYVDNPLLIGANGAVYSASHMGVVASGTTNVAGYLTVPVLESPTGHWSVTCNAARADTGAPLTVVGIPTSPTQVTFTCYSGTSAYQGPVQVLYHLIAY